MKRREELRSAREKAKLSQAGLARLVRTSQQQIQRIEAGHTVRLDLAARIVEALHTRLELVFPEMKHPTGGQKRQKEILIEAGIDPDPMLWLVKLKTRSSVERVYEVSSMDARRMRACLVDNEKGFLHFDAKNSEVMVNLQHLAFIHFLWEGAGLDEQIDAEVEPHVALWLQGSEPLAFSVDYEPEEGDDDDDEMGTVRSMLFQLSLEPRGFVSFDDADGEAVYVKPDTIEIVEVPHATFGTNDDDEDEAEAA